MKLIQKTLVYVLFFIPCVVVANILLQEWWFGVQALFAFGVPALLSLWHEKYTAKETSADTLEGSEATHKSASSSLLLKQVESEKRVALESKKTGDSLADTGRIALQGMAGMGVWCQLTHPGTGEELGVAKKRPTRIKVKGPDTMTHEQAVAHIVAMRSFTTRSKKQGGKENDNTDGGRKKAILRAQELEKVTLGWENIEWGGKPYLFNRQNAVKLYTEFWWIANQVSVFFEALVPLDQVDSETISTSDTPASVYDKVPKRKKQMRSKLSRQKRNQEQKKKFHRILTADKGDWVPVSKSVMVAGRDIGGMIYVGTPPQLNIQGYHRKCRAYVDPSLSVAQRGVDKAGHQMPYWPSYSEISPQCRATYLDWLASGRSDPSYNPGYMFLYFYGLERRFFVDQSEVDARHIVDEVRRLCSLYPDNHSVQRYLGEFLDIAILAVTELEDIEPTFERHGWELPISLKYAIGARVDKGDRLTADWLLSWFVCRPESNLRTAATRCREEFLALFRMRFDKRFPDGLKVNKPRKVLKAMYRAASSEFEGTINPTINGKPIPDITALRKPVEIAQEIADEAMADLDKFSRFLGRNPDGRGSVEAYALLPTELWQAFPSEELENLKAWAAEVVVGGGLVSLENAIERLEGERPRKISRRQLTAAADALARIGFGFAPDPRFALRSPKLEEPVVIFDLGESVERLEETSARYRNALINLALGTFVAHADGRISDLERRALEEQVVSVDGLSVQELRRLRANLHWYIAVPPDISLLRRKVKQADKAGQAAMRTALVAAAHADGMIQSEEVANIERVYKALGLNPSLVYSDLHAGHIDNEPRIVRAAQSGHPGEAIPDPEKTADHVLDAARIAAIQSDTERVSVVLGQIFDPGEHESTGKPRMPDRLLGLDQKHAELVGTLLEQKHWTEQDFEQLCARHALLAAGALETVNEWAFEAYEEPLLDEYEGYEIMPEVADAVRKKLKGGGYDVEIKTT